MSVRRALREAAADIFNEAWSDAARAASAAARRAKAKGGDWRKAARSEFYKGGRPKASRTERNMAVANASADWHGGLGSRAYRMGSRASTALNKIGIMHPLDSFDRLDRGTKGEKGRFKHTTPGTKAQYKYFSRAFSTDRR